MDFLDTDGDCIQFLIDPKGKLREWLGIFLHYIECNEMSPLFLWELKQLWIHRITDENKLFKGRKHHGLAKNGKNLYPKKTNMTMENRHFEQEIHFQMASFS